MSNPILYGPSGEIVSTSKDLNLDPTFFLRRAISGATVSSEVSSNPYANQPFVYACANAIASNISRLPRVLFDRTNPEKETRLHSLLDLFQRPNELMSGDQLWEVTLLNLLLPTATTPGGQCFWVGIGKNGDWYDFTSKDVPYYLFPFSDRFFRPIISDTSLSGLIGWEYSPPGRATKIPFQLNQVLRFVLTNPANLFQGQSPLAAAKYSILQDAKSTELNTAYFENGASLGGVLQTDQKLTDAQAKQMAVSWRENHSGSDNAGKTAVLHTGLKYETLETSHEDMQYIEQKKLLREDILAVFGVPKAEVALYEDVNYATALSADKSFWEKKLIPFDEKILKVINGVWLRYFLGGQYGLKSDFSRVECLRAGLKDQVETMKTLVSMAVPVKEAARLANVPLNTKPYSWLDEAFVNANLVLASSIDENPKTLAAPAPSSSEGNEEPAKITPSVPAKKKRLKTVYDAALVEHSIRKHILKSLDSMEKFYENKIDPLEKAYRIELGKFFIAQRNKVLDAVDAWEASKTTKVLDVPKSFWDEIVEEEDKKLAKISAKYYDDVIKVQTEKMKDELGGELVNFEIDNTVTQKFIAARLEQLQELNTTTFKAAGKEIIATIEALPPDTSVAQAAKAIKNAIEEVYSTRKNQAKTIARTELAIVSSSTRNEIMKEEGIEQQEWLSIIDDHTRDGTHGEADHVSMNGEIVKLGEAFSNGLMFPSDPSGAAGEIINCRCAAIPYFEKQ